MGNDKAKGEKGLTNKQRMFVESYLACWNATEAAREAGYTHPNKQGPALLVNLGIQAAIKQRLEEKVMSADEVLTKLSEQARADIGVFFKLVEEWTFFPLPTYDIIDAKEVVDESDPDNPTKRVSYWVRHVSIDTDKLVDPQYSHLLHKFSDSPKNGLGIEIYNKQIALQTLAKHYGLLRDKVELTGKDGDDVKIIVTLKAQDD